MAIINFLGRRCRSDHTVFINTIIFHLSSLYQSLGSLVGKSVVLSQSCVVRFLREDLQILVGVLLNRRKGSTAVDV